MLTGRSKEIVNRVDHLGSVSVGELAEQFGVAVETIRRDLRVLEEAGYLRRTHGGATSLLDDMSALTFNHRQQENPKAKQAIAQTAATLVSEGQRLMLDNSSSSWYVAQALPNMNLTIITNSVRIVLDMVRKPSIRTICIGGDYSEKYGGFLGSITVSHILEFQADICFFSCAGYEEETGAWDSNDLNAVTKRAMLKSSRTNVLLCDRSKLKRQGQIIIQNAESIHCMINEDGMTGALQLGGK